MFAAYSHQPRNTIPTPNPFSLSPSSSPYFSLSSTARAPTPIPASTATTLDYDAYDARRCALERRTLATEQQERRDVEEASIRRHQQLEVERLQQRAVYEALARRQAEEVAHRVAVQQRQREVEHDKAIRDAIELKRRELEEVVRREVERRRALQAQAQAQAQAQTQADAQARARQQQAQAQAQAQQQQTEGCEVDLVQLLSQLFNSAARPSPVPTPAANATASSSSQIPTPSVPIPISTPTPTPLSSTLPIPVLTPPKLDEPSSPVDAAAAETLQRHFRAHLARRAALSTLSTLSSSFVALQSSFVPPTSLVFAPSPPSSVHANGPDDAQPAPAAKLAYSPANSGFLAYEDFLVGLLSKLDAVQSGGDKSVKTARKELVRRVEAELRKLDEQREAEWAKTKKDAQIAVVAAESANVLDAIPAAEPTATPVETPVEPPVASEPASSSTVDVEPSSSLSAVALDSSSDDAVLESTPVATPSPSLDAPSNITVDATSSPTPITPITPDTLATLPSDSPSPQRDSDSDSTASNSTIAVDAEDLVEQVLRTAEKLGQEVVRLEQAELEEEFVVV